MKPFVFPRALEDLPHLEVRRKGDWKKADAKLVGAMVRSAERVGFGPAKKFMNNYTTVIGRTMYVSRNFKFPVSPSLMAHEGTHIFQKDSNNRHWMRYNTSKRYRRHAEAQAYAVEVVFFAKPFDDAVTSLCKPIYRMKWSRSEATELLQLYADGWQEVPRCR